MSEQYPKNYKYCVVCDFWGGHRDVDNYGGHVTVESPGDKGKCLKQGGSYKGQDRQQNASCGAWQQWCVLK